MFTHRSSLAPHVDGLDRGELMISICAACATPEFPPRTQCGSCGDTATPNWRSSSGAGRLWSFASFHKTYLPDFHLRTPYVVAVIELDDGVRLYGNVTGTPMSELHVGQPVQCQFGTAHLVFTTSDREAS